MFSVFALGLPCKSEKHGNYNVALCVVLLTNAENTSKLSSVIDRLSFTRKKRSTVCTRQGQDRGQSIQPFDIYTVCVLHVCHDIERHVNYGRFSANTEKPMGIVNEIIFFSISTNEYLYSPIMITAL